MKKNNIEIMKNVFVEKVFSDFYLIVPGVLVNRINPNNLDNFMEPQKTKIKNAIDSLSNRKEI
jgi:hypothetical protein